MAGKELTIRINVRQGPAKGKRFTLKNEVCRIGSDAACDITIDGPYVSPEHAIISRREDGLWRLQNKSVNRTLVNQQAVDSRQLESGDLIQVGAETLLEFEILKKKEKEKSKRTKREKSGAGAAGLLKRPGLVLGFAFYIFVLIAGGFYLQSVTGESTGTSLSAREAKRALTLTRTFLNSATFSQAAPTIAASSAATGQSEDASGYYRLAFLLNENSAANSLAAEQLIDKMLEEGRAHLALAWHYEEQQRWQSAIAVYREIMAMMPDIRVPLVKLAVRRISELEKLSEEQ